ncbi:MAG: DivIVA domain-containing protein, partial [Actinomycetes bacterium]
MALTPEEVRNKQFTTVRLREGYDEDEVDAFLDEIEAELARLLRENDELRQRTASTPAAPAAPATPAGGPSPVPSAVPT